MSVFDEKRAELQQHEFMMGVERGRPVVRPGTVRMAGNGPFPLGTESQPWTRLPATLARVIL